MYPERLLCFKLLLSCFGVLASLTALCANDTEVRWHGEEVRIVSSGKLKMVSEDILIEGAEVGGNNWRVDAKYRLKNLSSDTVRVSIAFPEPTIDDRHFVDFKTMIRGEEVDYSVAKRLVSEEGRSYGRSYVFNVEFLPDELIEIRHLYGYVGTYGVLGPWVEYVTRTGASWLGPIDSARFTIIVYDDVYQPTSSIYTPVEYPITSALLEKILYDTVGNRVVWDRFPTEGCQFYDGEPATYISKATFVIEKRNWVPATDISILLSGYSFLSPYPCVNDSIARLFDRDPAELHRIKVWSDTVLLSLFSCYDDSVLVAWEERIFARYGRRSSDETRNAFLFNPRHEAPIEEPSEKTLYYPFIPFENYSDKILTRLDHDTIELIHRILDARRSEQVNQ